MSGHQTCAPFIVNQEDVVPVKKKSTRWQGNKKSAGKASGEATAESDRKLQRDAESRRKGKSGESRQSGAVQDGARRYPEPPEPMSPSST